MDLFDYSNYESDSFIDSAPPPDFRVQRTRWDSDDSIFFKGGEDFITILKIKIYSFF